MTKASSGELAFVMGSLVVMGRIELPTYGL